MIPSNIRLFYREMLLSREGVVVVQGEVSGVSGSGVL